MREMLVVIGAFGHPEWQAAARRQRRELSRRFGTRVCIEIFSNRELFEIVDSREKEFILQNSSVGFGLWYWKPLIILEAINRNKMVEKVFYSDAGNEISWKMGQRNERSKSNLEFSSPPLLPDRLLCLSGEDEKKWCNPEVFKEIGINSRWNEDQIHAGLFIFSSEEMVEICRHWRHFMKQDNFRLLRSKAGTNNGLKWKSRHDQSIFNCIVKKMFEPEDCVKLNSVDLFNSYGIACSRNRSMISTSSLFYKSRLCRRLVSNYSIKRFYSSI